MKEVLAMAPCPQDTSHTLLEDCETLRWPQAHGGSSLGPGSGVEPAEWRGDRASGGNQEKTGPSTAAALCRPGSPTRPVSGFVQAGPGVRASRSGAGAFWVVEPGPLPDPQRGAPLGFPPLSDGWVSLQFGHREKQRREVPGGPIAPAALWTLAPLGPGPGRASLLRVPRELWGYRSRLGDCHVPGRGQQGDDRRVLQGCVLIPQRSE